MPDQFVKVTTKGYGTRIGESVGRVVVGILLFLGSFGLLFWNEGRADLSTVANKAIDVGTAQDGDLVWVTGEVSTDAKIGDDLYLDAGDYLAVERNVEMYAWVEKTEESSTTNVGGSETTTTTYDYVKEWENLLILRVIATPTFSSRRMNSLRRLSMLTALSLMASRSSFLPRSR